MKKFAKRWLPTVLYMLGGNLLLVLGLELFLGDNGIAAGGFSGIAIIVNYVVEVPVGLFVLALTLPFLVWGWFTRGREFVLLTAVSTGMYAVLADSLTFLPCLTHDMLLASICGGLLYGAAAVLFLRGNSSSGGTDLLARIIVTYWRSASLGTVTLAVDGLVIAASMLVAGQVEIGVYAVVSLAVCCVTTDILIQDFNKANVFFIITERDLAPLCNAIHFRMGRSATLINGTGMYAAQMRQENPGRSILMVVVKPRQVFQLRDLVRREDPGAFVVQCPASGILGEGFPILEADVSDTPRRHREK